MSYGRRQLEGLADEDHEPLRVLITLLFTDIVGSTGVAAQLGDRRWLRLVENHHAKVRELLARFGGREVDCAGDGFFATFRTATSAIACGDAITSASDALGLETRAALHTGECERIDGKFRGIAVHTAARLIGFARPGETLVTATVRDIVAGSGIRFEDRGTRTLKGVPGLWQLFAVTNGELTALHPVIVLPHRTDAIGSGQGKWRGGLPTPVFSGRAEN